MKKTIRYFIKDEIYVYVNVHNLSGGQAGNIEKI